MATRTSTTASGAGELLERSAQLALLDERLRAVRGERKGRLVLVSGEAGIGKTALVRRFCEDNAGTRQLWGACDALHTPRPLGPFLDFAAGAGAGFAAVADEGAAPGALVDALGRELSGSAPTLVVLEDLHWADEATLDALKLLVRRIESWRALVLATYRDDGLDGGHPLRIALGEASSRMADRVVLEPLSVQAVEALAGPQRSDHGELHARTGGNPFYVTEVIAGSEEAIPGSVRDAVLARAARLDPGARALLDAVAIVPPSAELWLLEALTEGDLDGLDSALASGMLRAGRESVGFRHEIARVALEDELAPHRRVALHRRALAALADAPAARADLARLAHHAEAAGDAAAVLRWAPAAGERAATLRSHREAAAQFGRALRYAGGLPPAERAHLFERRAYECYLTDQIAEAIAARQRALDEHRAAGDRLREGDTHRWLSRLGWFGGDRAMAVEEGRGAVELLEAEPPGRELAMAYSNMSQLSMLAFDQPGATRWGGLAIALAEQLGETEIVVHALNNVGSAELMLDLPGAREKLERSLELALAAGHEEHVARAYTNLGALGVTRQDYATGDRYLDAGIEYCREHDLDMWLVYMSGHRARSELDQGHWDEAAARASFVVGRPDTSAPSKIMSLAVLGRLRARRGDPEHWPPLDEGLALARGTSELQRLAPVTIARAEVHWLGGDAARLDEETAPLLAPAVEQGDIWSAGELALWRQRAGLVSDVRPEDMAEPYRLELAGAHEEAAAVWRNVGCPFEAALALAHAGSEDAQRRGLDELQRLGAAPAYRRIAHAMRERGVRDVPHGPRATTRANAAGITARELEVLELVAQGLRNADIAERLFVSEKTVAHHVSAILRKLHVRSRGQAVAEAVRLGLVER